MHVMTRLPELRALLRRRRPAELDPALLGRQVLHLRHLLLDAARRPVELEKQGRRYGVVELRIGIHRGHRRVVEQLDAGDGMPAWMVATTVSTAASTEGKGHTAAMIASGMP